MPEHHADRYWRIAQRCGAVERPVRKTAWKANPKECVIGLCPGAEYGSAKRWPAYKFQSLVKEMNELIDCQWVIVGTAADTPLAQEISRGVPNITDLTGKTSLGELMDLLSKLTGLVTNDTGRISPARAGRAVWWCGRRRNAVRVSCASARLISAACRTSQWKKSCRPCRPCADGMGFLRAW